MVSINFIWFIVYVTLWGNPNVMSRWNTDDDVKDVEICLEKEMRVKSRVDLHSRWHPPSTPQPPQIVKFFLVTHIL